MADTPTFEIIEGDYVNGGKIKFNQAVQYLPIALSLTPEGILTLSLYKKPALTVDLADLFPTRLQVGKQFLPGDATKTKKGIVQLADETKAADLDSESKVLSAGAVNRLIEAINLEDLTNKSTDPILDFLFASLIDKASNETIQALCARLADAGCGGSAKKVTDFNVLGPDLVDEPASGSADFQYYAMATFDDGSIDQLTTGIVCSIIATAGETIDATGKVTVPHDSTAGNNRQYTVRIGYRLPGQTNDTVKQKVTTVRDTNGLIALTPTGVVKYFNAVAGGGGDSNPVLTNGWKGSLDGGGCDKVSGWIAKLDNLEVSRTVDLTADGVLVAENVVCTIVRPDVRAYLRQNQNVPNLQNQTFGYEWTVPAYLRKGAAIVWRAYVSGTQTELTFSPRTSDVCADETQGPPVLAGNYSGSHEYADCDGTGGWIVNLSNKNISPEVDVKVNGVYVGTSQAYQARPDVASAVGSANYNLYQWRLQFPDTLHTGIALNVQAFVKGTNTLLTFSPRTTAACSSAAATVVSRYVAKPSPSITEGGMGMQLTLMERMSFGPDRACPDPVTWAKPGTWPAGVSLSASGIIACTDGAISENIVVTASATANNDTQVATVQVINVGCTRNNAGFVNVKLVYNFIPASGGNARLFSSLADANETMGKVFDGRAPGSYGTPYLVQVDPNYTIGTPAWFLDGTDCTKSDDGIRYVVDTSGGNTKLIALLITNGLIADKLVSTYQTPVPPVSIGSPCKTYEFDNTSAPNTNPVIFDDSSLFNVTGLLTHFHIDTVNINPPVGAGLRGPDVLHGYALVLYPNQGTVAMTNQGVAFGPNFQFNWEAGKSYWLRMQYFETDNNTARILAAIWPDTQPETNVVFDWQGVPRLSGYPILYGGSRSGSGSLFDKLYLYGCGGVMPTDYKAYVDNADCTHVDGWVADSLHFNTPVTLPIYVDGVQEGTVTATIANPGVSNVYGWNNTTGHIYGFNWPLPAKFRNGQTHVITIRDTAGNLVSGNSLQMPACQPAQLVNSVAIYRRSDNILAFLYRSSVATNQNLEDKWEADTQDYLPSSYTTAPVSTNPAGYEGYQYFDSYGTARAALLAALANSTTFSIRKIGETTPLVSFQFTAANLQLGEVRVIYTAP